MIRLEAESSNTSENEVDKDEITFSRTRIEQIIGNMMRQKEYHELEEQRQQLKDALPEFGKDQPEMIEDELKGFMNPVENEGDKITIDANEFSEDSSEAFLRGIDSCISTVESYSRSSVPKDKTKELRAKIDMLQKAINALEKLLH